jgi:hypothetical protein
MGTASARRTVSCSPSDHVGDLPLVRPQGRDRLAGKRRERGLARLRGFGSPGAGDETPDRSLWETESGSQRRSTPSWFPSVPTPMASRGGPKGRPGRRTF